MPSLAYTLEPGTPLHPTKFRLPLLTLGAHTNFSQICSSSESSQQLCRIYIKLIAYIHDFMFIIHLHTFFFYVDVVQPVPSKQLNSLDGGLKFRLLEGKESVC